MPTEMGGEAVEIITMAVDKFQANTNYEVSWWNEITQTSRVLMSKCLFASIKHQGICPAYQEHDGQKVRIYLALYSRRRIWIRNNMSKEIFASYLLWESWNSVLQMLIHLFIRNSNTN